MEPNHNQIEIIQEPTVNKAEDKMDLQENQNPEPNQHNEPKILCAEYTFNKNFFVERSFHESFDGYYDDEDFFHTPEGSFFNQNREYFNRYGFNKYGGHYDEMGLYIPGEGWNSDFQCYEEDMDEEILKNQVDQIEGVFQDQIQIGDGCNLSLISEENVEEEKVLVNEPVDFFNVKEVMEAEAREQALHTGQIGENHAVNGSANPPEQLFGTASAVKNGFSGLNNANENNQFFSGSAVKNGVASASKIVNINLLSGGGASHAKASAVKGDFTISNANDGNNFSFNNANNQLINLNNNNIDNQVESGNMQHNANSNSNANDFSTIKNNIATGDENTLNVGGIIQQNLMPTPVKSNYVHEPTPYKASATDVHEENKI